MNKTIYLSADRAKRAQELAKTRGQSVSGLIASLIDDCDAQIHGDIQYHVRQMEIQLMAIRALAYKKDGE